MKEKLDNNMSSPFTQYLIGLIIGFTVLITPIAMTYEHYRKKRNKPKHIVCKAPHSYCGHVLPDCELAEYATIVEPWKEIAEKFSWEVSLLPLFHSKNWAICILKRSKIKK